MGKRLAFCGMAVVLFVYVLSELSPCQAAKLTDSQIRAIQSNIHNSTDLSTKCLELHNNAEQNRTIALSNYRKTSIQGFRQCAEIYAEAKSKFLAARKIFDDAWIEMQYGMGNGDLSQVQEGVNLHNNAVKHFNDAVQVLNRAGGIFKQAYQESQNHAGSKTTFPTRTTHPTADGTSSWGILGFPQSGVPQHHFPIAALIILIGTIVTSLQAFKDQGIYDRYILHPWSIVRHKTRGYTLISSGLIHADPMHLTMNLISFSFFALPLEGIIGHLRFILVYFGSLIVSSMVVTARHGNEAYYRCLGASGAISGVIFSYIIYRPTAKISMFMAPVGVPAPVFALAYVGYSYYMGKKNIDNIGRSPFMGSHRRCADHVGARSESGGPDRKPITYLVMSWGSDISGIKVRMPLKRLGTLPVTPGSKPMRPRWQVMIPSCVQKATNQVPFVLRYRSMNGTGHPSIPQGERVILNATWYEGNQRRGQCRE